MNYGRRIWAGFALAALTLAAAGTIGARSISDLAARDAWVEHTYLVIENLWQLDYAGDRAVGAARIFVLSGDPRYARDAADALARSDRDIAAIAVLIADNPNQRERLRHLKESAARRADYLRGLIDARRTGAPDALARLNDPNALALDLAVRHRSAAMRSAERALLAERAEASRRAARAGFDAIALGTALAFVFVGTAGVHVNRGLAALNSRTLELAASRDESRRHAELLGAVIENINEALLVCDAHGRPLLRNVAAERIAGPVDAGGDGKWDYELFAESGQRLNREHTPIMRALRGEASGNAMVLLRRRGNRGDCWLEVSAAPLRAEGGAIRGAMAIARDITARRNAERERAHLAAIVESSHDAIFSAALDGAITSWNPGAERMFGYAAADAIGRPLALLEASGGEGDLQRKIQALIAGRATATYEFRVRRRDGANIDISVTLAPLFSAAGVVGGISAIARDITARKHKERELGELAAIVKASHDAIASGAPDGAIATWNPGAERLFGYRAAEIVGRSFSLLEPEQGAGEISRTLARIVAAPDTCEFEMRALRRDGAQVEVSAVFSPILDSRANLAGISAVFRDISESNRIARELAERGRELERSNADLEQFAYTASHDLQEPLRMVASYVQLLRERYRGKLDRDADDFIDFAVDGATRMKQLINDLLTYSRAGKGRDFARVDSAAPLRWALSNLELATAEAGARITHGAMPRVMADEAQLGELFQNLIGNALKFRGDCPPEIHIAAERKGRFWEFAVADNGIGIDPRHNARIFLMFQRLHSHSSYPGTGIGLAICRRIVDRHGGKIWVESEVGKGTTFRFTIPAAMDEFNGLHLAAERTQWRATAEAN